MRREISCFVGGIFGVEFEALCPAVKRSRLVFGLVFNS